MDTSAVEMEQGTRRKNLRKSPFKSSPQRRVKNQALHQHIMLSSTFNLDEREDIVATGDTGSDDDAVADDLMHEMLTPMGDEDVVNVIANVGVGSCTMRTPMGDEDVVDAIANVVCDETTDEDEDDDADGMVEQIMMTPNGHAEQVDLFGSNLENDAAAGDAMMDEIVGHMATPSGDVDSDTDSDGGNQRLGYGNIDSYTIQ